MGIGCLTHTHMSLKGLISRSAENEVPFLGSKTRDHVWEPKKGNYFFATKHLVGAPFGRNNHNGRLKLLEKPRCKV